MANPEKNSTKTDVLLVKHLPSVLSKEEKSELLKCFGAIDVRVMPSYGQYKHTAFAAFSNAEQANAAINRLHQLEILGCILSAEYARKAEVQSSAAVPLLKGQFVVKDKDNKEAAEERLISELAKPCKCNKKLAAIAPRFGLEYGSNPGLKYLYPEANADVLINICSALLTVPQFYTQVLHLMNKMNLYAPFSPAAFVPPVLIDHFSKIMNLANLSQATNLASLRPEDPPNLAHKDMSESESELETDEEPSLNLDRLPPKRATKGLKRKRPTLSTSPKRKFSRLKHETAIKTAKNTTVHKPTVEKSKLGEMFDNLSKENAKHHNISLAVPSIIPGGNENETLDVKRMLPSIAEPEKPQICNENSSGFGKINPLYKPINKQDTDENKDYVITKDFITEHQLETGRLSPREIASHSLYNNYDPGQPSCRLYVKNLHKKVTEKDVQHIFGRFVDFENVEEAKMFDVRLMTQGRMKGQAFIGLPSIEAATKAVKLVNGYQLMGKAIVVLYARSAKPKSDA